MTASSDALRRFDDLYREGRIDGVAVVAADADACPACAPLADRVYAPRELPALPIAACSSPRGCRCRYEPSVTVPE